MNEAAAMDVARQGLQLALSITLPLLGVALAVGLAVSVIQAVTQVQEATLTYVPKLVGVSAVLVVMGTWMIGQMVKFAQFCLEQASRMSP